MLHQFLGFKSHSRDAVPDVLYIGHDASAGAKASAATGAKYVRLGRITIGTVIPIALPESDEHKKLRETAEAAVKKSAQERAEADAAKTKADASPNDTGATIAALREELEAKLAEANAELAAAEKPAAKKKAEKAVAAAQAALDEFNADEPGPE